MGIYIPIECYKKPASICQACLHIALPAESRNTLEHAIRQDRGHIVYTVLMRCGSGTAGSPKRKVSAHDPLSEKGQPTRLSSAPRTVLKKI